MTVEENKMVKMNVEEVIEKIKSNPEMDWFEIGYEMIQNVMDKNNMNELGYCDFMNAIQEHDERLVFLVLMKNLVSQVNNGGFSQYFFNGYASFDKHSERDGDVSAHEYLIELFKKYVPCNKDTENLLKLLYNFMDNVSKDECDYCDGYGNVCEECECETCGGKGYIIEGDEEYTCDDCRGIGSIEEETTCCECYGSGEGDFYSYHGNDDDNFYDVFTDNKNMEKLFKDMVLNWLNNWDKDCKLNQFEDKKNETDSISKEISKPKLKLVGTDGNAFSIIGRLIDCLRRNGYDYNKIEEIKKECMSGDYNNVIATACKYCEVY